MSNLNIPIRYISKEVAKAATKFTTVQHHLVVSLFILGLAFLNLSIRYTLFEQRLTLMRIHLKRLKQRPISLFQGISLLNLLSLSLVQSKGWYRFNSLSFFISSQAVRNKLAVLSSWSKTKRCRRRMSVMFYTFALHLFWICRRKR